MVENELNVNKITDESALCQACGLCCQGQLYSWVALLPEEVALAATWPVEMVMHQNVAGFNQPCGCFQEQRCSVYAQRPRTCAQYSCQLLRRLRQNAISQSAALERVAQARELFEKIQMRLPAMAGKRIWQRILERWDLMDPQSLLASGELDSETLMAIIALDVFLKKYFHNAKNNPAGDR